MAGLPHPISQPVGKDTVKNDHPRSCRSGVDFFSWFQDTWLIPSPLHLAGNHPILPILRA